MQNRILTLHQRQLASLVDDISRIEAVSYQGVGVVPLDLLRRRPDIQQAERELASATARIGVATADLFPQVSLVDSIGEQGQGWGTTPAVNKHIWSFGPVAVWPLLGRRDAGGAARVDAQRQFHELQEQYAAAQVSQGEHFVQLYKSLGGGWQNYQAIPDIRRPQPAIIAAFHRVLTSSSP